MKYLDYKEQRNQGTFNFPIAFYHEMPHSPRYYMPYHWHYHFEIIRIVAEVSSADQYIEAAKHHGNSDAIKRDR